MHTLKRFIQYYRPYKTIFFLDLLCATFISIVDLLYPQFLRGAINGLFTESTDKILAALVPIGIGLFLMYVLQSLCKYYVSYQGHMMGAYMERDMRSRLFDHYEKLSFSYYNQNNSGQMMSKLVSDLFDIAEFAHHGPENLFISLIKIIGSFIFLFLINWRLAIPLSVLVICMLIFSISQNKRMQETFFDNRRKIGDVNASLQDTLAGIRVVQSFANEDIEREKFAKSNHGFLMSKNANYKCMGDFTGGNLFFQGMMYLVTLVYGGYLIARGQMGVVDLSMYALYIGIFISPIQILVELMEMMQKGLSGFRRYLDVMDTEIEIKDAPDAKPLKDIKGNVTYENVSFHYPDDDAPVLEHVSFDIPAGRSIALVGPSGSGKSTLLNIIGGIDQADSGDICIRGERMADMKEKKLTLYRRKHLGYIFQMYNLIPNLTVRENVEVGAYLSAKPLDVDELLHTLGLYDHRNKLPNQLSGGQQQRVSIARALAGSPSLILADEPTGALDSKTSRDVLGFLKQLNDEGNTIVMITHDSSIAMEANRVVRIHDGKINFDGDVEEYGTVI